MNLLPCIPHDFYFKSLQSDTRELTRSAATCVCFLYNSFNSLRELRTLSVAISLPHTSEYSVDQQMNAGDHSWEGLGSCKAHAW